MSLNPYDSTYKFVLILLTCSGEWLPLFSLLLQWPIAIWQPSLLQLLRELLQLPGNPNSLNGIEKRLWWLFKGSEWERTQRD